VGLNTLGGQSSASGYLGARQLSRVLHNSVAIGNAGASSSSFDSCVELRCSLVLNTLSHQPLSLEKFVICPNAHMNLKPQDN